MRRTAPLRRTSSRPRRQRAPRCKDTPVPELHNSRCDRHPVIGGTWCKTHSKAELDRRVRLQILDRDKWICRSGRPNHLGPIQWCHLETRGAPSTRWIPENSVAMCSGCHSYFTHRPHEWKLWMRERLGEQGYWDLVRRAALPEGPPDYVALLAASSEPSGESSAHMPSPSVDDARR
jgi:hypothetical protein